MSNVSNLTSKIRKDAEENRDRIISEANEQKAKILEKRNNQAKALEEEMVQKAEAEAQTRKERVISGAELQARNEKLKAKQIIIKEIFESSVKALSDLDDDKYKAFIKDRILSLDIVGDEVLILNEKGLKIIDASVLSEINNELASKGKKGAITLSNERGSFQGGFILEKDGIQINNTFEALVNSLKEELELEVAKKLFN